MKRFSRFLVVGTAAVFTSHLDTAQSTLTGSEVSCVPAGGHEVFGYLGVMTILDPSTFHGYTDSLQAYIDGIRSLGTNTIGDEVCDGIEVSFMKHQRTLKQTT